MEKGGNVEDTEKRLLECRMKCRKRKKSDMWQKMEKTEDKARYEQEKKERPPDLESRKAQQRKTPLKSKKCYSHAPSPNGENAPPSTTSFRSVVHRSGRNSVGRLKYLSSTQSL